MRSGRYHGGRRRCCPMVVPYGCAILYHLPAAPRWAENHGLNRNILQFLPYSYNAAAWARCGMRALYLPASKLPDRCRCIARCCYCRAARFLRVSVAWQPSPTMPVNIVHLLCRFEADILLQLPVSSWRFRPATSLPYRLPIPATTTLTHTISAAGTAGKNNV